MANDIQGFTQYLQQNGLSFDGAPSQESFNSGEIFLSETNATASKDEVSKILNQAFSQYPNLNFKGTINVRYRGDTWSFSWPMQAATTSY